MPLNLDEVVTKIEVPESQRSMGFSHGFRIVPSVAYPAMINHIRAVMSGLEYDGTTFYNLHNNANNVTERGWRLALTSDNIDLATLQADERNERAQALEIARLWLTELLHLSIGQQGMYINITREPKWIL